MLFVKNIANCDNIIIKSVKSSTILKKKCLFNALNANNKTFCMLIVKNLT